MVNTLNTKNWYNLQHLYNNLYPVIIFLQFQLYKKKFVNKFLNKKKNLNFVASSIRLAIAEKQYVPIRNEKEKPTVINKSIIGARLSLT